MQITQKPDPIGIHINDKNRQEAAVKIQSIVRGRIQKKAYKRSHKMDILIEELNKMIMKDKPKTPATEAEAINNMWVYFSAKNPERAKKIAEHTK